MTVKSDAKTVVHLTRNLLFRYIVPFLYEQPHRMQWIGKNVSPPGNLYGPGAPLSNIESHLNPFVQRKSYSLHASIHDPIAFNTFVLRILVYLHYIRRAYGSIKPMLGPN